MPQNTSSQMVAGVATLYDPTTQERVFKASPVHFDDDFAGQGDLVIPAAGSAVSGQPWVKKLVQTGGTPTVAGVANAIGGVLQAALDATSEKQEATLYFGDQKNFDVTKGLVIECRVNLSVLPSASGVQAVLGVASNWIDGPDNNAYYLEFGANGSGAINMRSQDGVTQNNIASGVTVVAGAWHIFHISAADPTNVIFKIDGAQVSTTGQLKFAATGTNAVLQPYLGVYKPSGTGVATLQVDYFRAWMNRQ